MEIEKLGVVTLGLLILSVTVVAGTTNFTGNAIRDFGNSTDPVSGMIILLVFVVAAVLVFRVFVPESRAPSRSY